MIPAAAILGYAMQALEIVPMLIKAKNDVTEFIGKTRDSMEKMQKENRGPTKEEKEELDEIIAGLRARLHDTDRPT